MTKDALPIPVAAECDYPSVRFHRGRGRTLAKLFRQSLFLRSTEIPPETLTRSALVFSPHPDDECLGCGGIILKKKRAGAIVKLVHMTDGSGSHAHLISKGELKAIRRGEAESAAAVLGVDGAYYLDFEDSALSGHIAAATERVLDILQREQPSEIFIPSRREPARQAADHLATTEIVLGALASYRGRVRVWEYPVWFWLHWPWVGLQQKGCPGIKTRHVVKNSIHLLAGLRAFREFPYSVDISDVLERKIAALEEHRSQMTELAPGLQWTTLGHVSRGQFLECFYSDREYFHCSSHGGAQRET